MAWCRYFTYMVAGKILRGLSSKLDMLNVQTRPFLSKFRGFNRNQPNYKHITLFLNPLNPKLFMCSTLIIRAKILKFQTFLTSLGNLSALNELFLIKMALN